MLILECYILDALSTILVTDSEQSDFKLDSATVLQTFHIYIQPENWFQHISKILIKIWCYSKSMRDLPCKCWQMLYLQSCQCLRLSTSAIKRLPPSGLFLNHYRLFWIIYSALLKDYISQSAIGSCKQYKSFYGPELQNRAGRTVPNNSEVMLKMQHLASSKTKFENLNTLW